MKTGLFYGFITLESASLTLSLMEKQPQQRSKHCYANAVTSEGVSVRVCVGLACRKADPEVRDTVWREGDEAERIQVDVDVER